MCQRPSDIPNTDTNNNYHHPIRFYLLWIIASLFYYYENFLQVFPSTIKAELSLAFSENSLVFGSFASCFAFGYGIMQIPAGIMIDRFSIKKTLPIAWLMVAFSSFLFSISHILLLSQAARIVMGLGSAFAFVACLKLINSSSLQKQFSFLIGLTITLGYLGATSSLWLSNDILALLNWRAFFYYASIIGLIGSIVIFYLFQKSFSLTDQLEKTPKQKQSILSKNTTDNTTKQIIVTLKTIAQDKQFWFLSLFAGFMFIPSAVIGILWGIPFLMEAHGFSLEQASGSIIFIYFGWIIGAPFWGKISNNLKNNMLSMTMFFANIGLLYTTLFFILGPTENFLITHTTIFLIGFFSSGYMLVYKKVDLIYPEKSNIATTIGFIHTINCLCSILSQSLVSLLIELIPRTTLLVKYQLSFLLIPFCLIISLILLYLEKETSYNTKEPAQNTFNIAIR